MGHIEIGDGGSDEEAQSINADEYFPQDCHFFATYFFLLNVTMILMKCVGSPYTEILRLFIIPIGTD